MIEVISMFFVYLYSEEFGEFKSTQNMKWNQYFEQYVSDFYNDEISIVFHVEK